MLGCKIFHVLPDKLITCYGCYILDLISTAYRSIVTGYKLVLPSHCPVYIVYFDVIRVINIEYLDSRNEVKWRHNIPFRKRWHVIESFYLRVEVRSDEEVRQDYDEVDCVFVLQPLRFSCC